MSIKNEYIVQALKCPFIKSMCNSPLLTGVYIYSVYCARYTVITFNSWPAVFVDFPKEIFWLNSALSNLIILNIDVFPKWSLLYVKQFDIHQTIFWITKDF